MQRQIKAAFILLLAVAALLSSLAYLTNAFHSLGSSDPLLFGFASFLFISSILAWLFSWALLLKSESLGLGRILLLGFSCVFAALTPIQIGAEALRSIKLKEAGLVSYRQSISASMVVKGLKFLMIFLVASAAFFASLLNPELELWLKAAMLSGFAVVAIAAMLFLLPLKHSVGLKIAGLFKSMSRFFRPFGKLSEYFIHYSGFLRGLSLEKLAAVTMLAFLSLLLEFLAFLFCFHSANTVIPLYSAVTLFSILVILERTPFLPRGILAVEAVGFIFLSLKSFTSVELSPASIAAVIIIFDVIRLVIPTILSLLAYSLFFSKKGRP
ncbi:MAG: flippase-like domain-containing protein [Candidatus Diapherotrites archaeon]|uniref:Flippase-like domain-containing protein n=1 Tax=Candidatus Iainarchaeum sp. TaxID=3101447 RepID=A0A938YTQ0_9ARCH|nr:flippase-like domain-containing protein [Candidatus Diapherotrites archaeon]